MTPPLRKYGCHDLWQWYWTTQNIRQLQPLCRLLEKEGMRKGTTEVKSGGQFVGAECIFMSPCLSSFFFVWLCRHKFSPSLPLFLHLSCFLLACWPSKSALIDLPLQPVCKLSPQFLSGCSACAIHLSLHPYCFYLLTHAILPYFLPLVPSAFHLYIFCL